LITEEVYTGIAN